MKLDNGHKFFVLPPKQPYPIQVISHLISHGVAPPPFNLPILNTCLAMVISLHVEIGNICETALPTSLKLLSLNYQEISLDDC